MRSVTVFGCNRPKMGDDLENPIQYLSSLHESSCKEVFLRKFESKVYKKLFIWEKSSHLGETSGEISAE